MKNVLPVVYMFFLGSVKRRSILDFASVTWGFVTFGQMMKLHLNTFNFTLPQKFDSIRKEHEQCLKLSRLEGKQ